MASVHWWWGGFCWLSICLTASRDQDGLPGSLCGCSGSHCELPGLAPTVYAASCGPIIITGASSALCQQRFVMMMGK